MAIKGVITKRLYVKYTRCLRSARYEANDPGAAKLSLTVQQRRQETRELAYLARALFPDGERPSSASPVRFRSPGSLRRTASS